MTSADAPPPLDFESWAALSALSDVDEQQRRYAALGAGPSWHEVDDYWARQLAGDLIHQHMDRLRRYAAACARALTRASAQLPAATAAAAPTITAAPTIAAGAASPFLAAMGGAAAAPTAPAPGQQHTALRLGGAQLAHELRAAEAASRWSVEQWACFCCELARAADNRDAVYHRYGLVAESSREIVSASWAERLDSSAALRTRFEAAMRQQGGG